MKIFIFSSFLLIQMSSAFLLGMVNTKLGSISKINLSKLKKNETKHTIEDINRFIKYKPRKNIRTPTSPLKNEFSFEAQIENYPEDVCLKNSRGETCLHLAVKCNNLRLVGYLLRKTNIDINAKNNEGQTALHIAVELQNYKIIQSLIANPNIEIYAKNKEGQTAFQIAMHFGDYKSAKILLNKQNEVLENIYL